MSRLQKMAGSSQFPPGRPSCLNWSPKRPPEIETVDCGCVDLWWLDESVAYMADLCESGRDGFNIWEVNDHSELDKHYLRAGHWMLSQSSGCQSLSISDVPDHLVLILAAASHDVQRRTIRPPRFSIVSLKWEGI
jgi:hypothetical protein